MKKSFLQKFRTLSQTITSSPVVRFIKRYKRIIGIIIILAFFGFFGYYLYAHPEVIQSIFRIGYLNASLLIVFYAGVVMTNVGIMYATIRLCHKKLALKSGILLTIYSSVINFFGPLQSGPGVRAIYLKTKIGLRIRDYTYAMLFYYFSFGALNVSLLFINKLPWLTLLGIIATVAIIAFGVSKFGLAGMKKYIFYIFILTAVQIIFLVLTYTVELHAVSPAAHYSLWQVVSYTGSANLSLFVSLTPGAIGIREAFLIFAQSLHNISLSSIIAAGVVDRAVYIIFLVLLFVISSSMHLKDAFVTKKKL